MGSLRKTKLSNYYGESKRGEAFFINFFRPSPFEGEGGLRGMGLQRLNEDWGYKKSDMKNFELSTHSPEQTQELGKHIGGLALPGDIFLLVGELGAGKTCLLRALPGVWVSRNTP